MVSWARQPRRLLKLEFSHRNWPLAAGVLEDRRRLGLSACIADASFATVLSEAAICTAAQRREGTAVWFVSSSQRAPSGESGPEESIGSVRVWIPD